MVIEDIGKVGDPHRGKGIRTRKIVDTSLQKIVQNHSLILIDTSVLSNSLGADKYLHTLSGIGTVLEEEHQFRMDLMHYLKIDSPIFITPLVCKEYDVMVNCGYIRPIEVIDGKNQISRIDFLKRRKMNSRSEEKDLFKILEKECIYRLKEEKQMDLYDRFSRRYSWFKNEGFLEEFNMKEPLSETDFDLLISAAVLSKFEKALALLTNDYGILKTWSRLCRDGRVSPRKFELFMRHFPVVFKKKYP